MIILGIDTSCDDTSIGIIKAQNNKGNFKILSNIISSQVNIHKKYGGVYPMLAKREHQKNLVFVFKKALKKANLLKIKNKKLEKDNKIQIIEKILSKEEILKNELIKFLEKYEKPKIDILSVTTGPGLDPCLWVGLNFTKSLSYYWEIPIVPANHIESHILVNFLDFNFKEINSFFPAVSLIVSGGHTQIILIKNIGKYKILGETLDDAAGECFDKTARILNLEYPGGPKIAEKAKKIKNKNLKYNISLPRPMINSKNYDFSFSGLKTAVLYKTLKDKNNLKNEKYIEEMCWEIQQSVIDVLIKKTIKAAKDYKAKAIFLGGGVSANNELRRQFKEKIKQEKLKINFFVPPKDLCTDNGIMVAISGYFNYLKNKTKKWKKIKINGNLKL